MRWAFRVAPWVVPAVPVIGFLKVAYVVNHEILNVLDKRLRSDAARHYKGVDRAIAVIRKMLVVAEKRCRRLEAPALMKDVWLGARYVDGLTTQTAGGVAT